VSQPGIRRWALLAVSVGVFCIQLDSFALNQALPRIGRDLHAAGNGLQWVISAYLLAAGMLMLGAGRLGDLYGRRRLLVLGLASFGASSLACALAPTLPILIAARVAQGAGGAMIMPVGLSLLTNVYPGALRGRATGRALGIGGIATACGPFVGGVLTDAASWRAVFWLNVPLAAFGAACAARTAESRGTGGRRWVDWPGLFRNGPYVALTLAGMVANAATVMFLFVVPLTLQGQWSLPVALAGMAFLPPALAMALTGPLAGRVASPSAVSVMAACLGLGAIVLACLAWASSLGWYLAAATAGGAVLGTANALTLIATQGVIRPERAGEASGVTKTLVTVAAGLGVALTGALTSHGRSMGTPAASSHALRITALGCLAGCLVLGGWMLASMSMPREA
jgi:predicted MFS family arabinose efflux permease